MAQTYQLNFNVNIKEQQMAAFETLGFVAQNAIQGYGFTIERLLLDGTGRIRVTLSQAFPAAEVESFQGAIIAVSG